MTNYEDPLTGVDDHLRLARLQHARFQQVKEEMCALLIRARTRLVAYAGLTTRGEIDDDVAREIDAFLKTLI